MALTKNLNGMKKRVILFLGTTLFSMNFYAQSGGVGNLGFSRGAQSFWADVASAAPYILATIFLVSAIANSGKLYGENRDYMAFFRGLFLWAGVLFAISALVTYILSIRF